MDCIFCKIISGEIPASIVYQDKDVVVFDDINPKAPVHCLIIPRLHIASVQDIGAEHGDIMASMMRAAHKTAELRGVDKKGYRLIINNGPASGQEVFHLHMHILAGREFLGPMLVEK